MGYKKNFRVQHGDAGHMPNGGLQSSMLFPDKRSFYTSRNVNSDLITESNGLKISNTFYREQGRGE